MRLRSSAPGLLSLVLLTAAAGCSPEGEGDTITSDSADLVGRVAGSSIASANVKANATYLTARGIAALEDVGAFDGTVGALAHRVDGIIANQPADGRFSIQEILTIEKPGFVDTLFPEEKAALPKLWALLETTKVAPGAVTLPALVDLAEADLSIAAGAPIKPATLAISSLPTALQTAAKRLELTRDADGDPTTVSEVDLDLAIATPGPYTPGEVQSFKDIKLLFVERATTSLSAKVRVTDPGVTKKTLATWGGASLAFEQSVTYRETRSVTFFDRSNDSHLPVAIDARLVRQATVTLPPNAKLLVLDETTESEQVTTGGALETAGGTATVELWSGGVRQGSYRTTLPALKSINERKDLGAFADYQFLGASGAPLVRNVVETRTNNGYGSRSSFATWSYDLAALPLPTPYEPQVIAATATPPLGVPAGRYEVPAGSVGTLVIDLYPEGVMRVTRPNGQTARSQLYVWTYAKRNAAFPDRLRAMWDAQKNKMTIFFDGQGTLYDGPLTAAMRKG